MGLWPSGGFWEASGRLLEASWGLLWPPGGLLGAIQGLLGASWGAPGRLGSSQGSPEASNAAKPLFFKVFRGFRGGAEIVAPGSVRVIVAPFGCIVET